MPDGSIQTLEKEQLQQQQPSNTQVSPQAHKAMPQWKISVIMLLSRKCENVTGEYR